MSRVLYQWNSGLSKGMPKRRSGLSELRMTSGYPLTTAHIDTLVS